MKKVVFNGNEFVLPDEAADRQKAVVVLDRNTAVMASNWKNDTAQSVRKIPHLPRNVRFPEFLADALGQRFCCKEMVFIAKPA